MRTAACAWRDTAASTAERRDLSSQWRLNEIGATRRELQTMAKEAWEHDTAGARRPCHPYAKQWSADGLHTGAEGL